MYNTDRRPNATQSNLVYKNNARSRLFCRIAKRSIKTPKTESFENVITRTDLASKTKQGKCPNKGNDDESKRGNRNTLVFVPGSLDENGVLLGIRRGHVMSLEKSPKNSSRSHAHRSFCFDLSFPTVKLICMFRNRSIRYAIVTTYMRSKHDNESPNVDSLSTKLKHNMSEQ